MKCEICQDSGWVCEKHESKAWPLECDCSPGMMCICNELDSDGHPEKSAIVIDDREIN